LSRFTSVDLVEIQYSHQPVISILKDESNAVEKLILQRSL